MPPGPSDLNENCPFRSRTRSATLLRPKPFRAPEAGTYRVDCAASRPLALGPYVTAGRILAGVGGILGAFFGGLLLGALIVCLVLLLRERSTRRLELEARGQALR